MEPGIAEILEPLMEQRTIGGCRLPASKILEQLLHHTLLALWGPGQQLSKTDGAAEL